MAASTLLCSHLIAFTSQDVPGRAEIAFLHDPPPRADGAPSLERFTMKLMIVLLVATSERAASVAAISSTNSFTPVWPWP